MNRVMISDFDVMSPLGSSREEFERGLFAGQSALTNLSGRYGGDFPVAAAGLIDTLEGRREPNMVAQKLIQQITNRQTGAPVDGVVFFIPQEDELTNSAPPPNSDGQAALIPRQLYEITGFTIPFDRFVAIHEGCVSGLTGLSLAAQRIRAGIWRRALVLGVDLRASPLDLLRFHALGALSRRRAPEASSPFSRERDGFVRSQAAAAFLLEGAPAQADSQTYWAEIKGFAQTSDAWRVTEGRPDCRGTVRAIEKALSMSGLDVNDIDCVSAHATSTPIGDALEARAIQLLWKSSAKHLPVTALKSQMGHAGQASGLLQVAAALLMIRAQRLLPTMNYRVPDPDCDLDCVPNESRAAKIDHVLCNATAFGGQNACLILARARVS